MADIFWITGNELKGEEPNLTEILASVGVRPHWVEVVHAIDDPSLAQAGAKWSAFQSVFRWPGQPMLCDFLLHDVCRSLMIREHNLIMLAESENGCMDYTLLASPQAVGRYNLMPKAHIAAWWALPPSTLNALPQKLEKSGFDRDCVQWVSGKKEIAEQARMVFPDIEQVETENHSTIGRLNGLIRRMDESKCSHGFLLAGADDSPLLATLVER